MHKTSRMRFAFFCSENRKSKIQNRKWLGLSVITFVLVVTGAVAQAQQPAKVPRLGYLSPGSPLTGRVEVIRLGLRELGYLDGKNILIESRYAEGKLDRLPALAAELVRLKVDIIVSSGATVTRAAKKATNSIPIVMAQDNDPIGNGFVASLARPGGNITGLSSYSAELNGKRLELLKEIVPRLSRLAVLGISTNPGNAQALRETELAVGVFGLQMQYLDVLEPEDIETGFRAASKGRADAVLVFGGPLFNSQRIHLVEIAVKSRLPAIYNGTEIVEDGGLMSYAASGTDLFRRSASYVDKILKGAKPADLPVEQPTKFELVINLKAAKQIGLTIPPNVLVRADRVIR